MATIIYIESDGSEHHVEVPAGASVMDGAVNSGVPGIDADCGGVCTCATCHVRVDPEWAERLPEKSDVEEAMLEFAVDVGPNSRLSCRLSVDDGLEGLVVHIPESQF
jgi:2Fe-2S ferredoxin